MPRRSRLSMNWLDAKLSAVMLLVVEEAAMKEYPTPCGGDVCRVVAGVSVDAVEAAVVFPCVEAAALL